MVPAKQTVFNSNPAATLARLISIVGIYILCFGSAALLAFQRAARAPRRKKIFIWIWVGPGLLFFTLIFLKFVNSGYLLVISPPVFAWLGLCASRVVCGCAAFEGSEGRWSHCGGGQQPGFPLRPRILLLRLRAPFRDGTRRMCLAESRGRVARGHDDRRIRFALPGIPACGILSAGMVYGAISRSPAGAGTRVFVMEAGDTRLAARLPLSRFRNFMFFPLPGGDR